MPAFPLYKWWALQIVILDPRLNNTAKVVFARLVERHNTKTGRCDPGEERQAIELNCKTRTIRNALRALEELGYIKTYRGAGMHGTNAYEFAWPTGKTEYQCAEKQLLSNRKVFSDKPMKKPLKKPRHGTTNPVDADVVFPKTCHETGDNADTRKTLEVEVLRLLGSGEDSWSKMMLISEHDWSSTESLLQNREITLNEALKKLLAKIHEQQTL